MNEQPTFVWNLDTVRKAADCIMEGFSWDTTEEGVEYWRNVHNALESIIEEAEAEEVLEDGD